MLVIGSSFARRDDVWMWSSNPLILKFGQIRCISASHHGRFAHGEVIQFFFILSNTTLDVSQRGSVCSAETLCMCKGLNVVEP